MLWLAHCKETIVLLMSLMTKTLVDILESFVQISLTLVGIIKCRDISKFSDTNTDTRHVQTCWKKAQKTLGQKNVLPSMLF